MPMTELANLGVEVIGAVMVGFVIVAFLSYLAYREQGFAYSDWLPKILGITLILAIGQQLLMTFNTWVVLGVLTVGITVGIFGFVMYGRQN